MTLIPEFESKWSKARTLFERGCYSEAEALYLELLQFGFAREALLRELVQLSLAAGEIKKSAEYCERLVRLFPEKLEYGLNSAKLYERAGLLHKAVEIYKVVLKKKPELANSQYNLARLLKMVGRREEATAVYEAALRYGITGPEEVHSNLAVIYSELHKEEKAFSHLDKALEIKPNYIPALFNMAALYEEGGNKAQAEACYRNILAIDRTYYPALCRLAHMRLGEKSRSELIGTIKNALANDGVDEFEREELYFALGQLQDESGCYDEAFASYAEGNALGRRRFTPYDKRLSEKYITELICQFDRDWFLKLRESSTSEPVFICGMFRSGSTLIEQILGRHSGVIAGGELGYFPDLVDRMRPGYPSSVGDMGWSFFQQVANRYLKYLNDTFGSEYLVTDKRPDNFLHIGLIKSAFPGAKIIWTQRALLDNCLSIFFQPLAGDMSYSVDLDSIGHYYSMQVRLMQHWKRLFPDSVYELSYENLVDEPKNEIRKLLEFLNLPWEDACLDFSGGGNFVKTASIWQIRESIYTRSVQRCRYYQKYLAVLDQYQV